MEAQNYCNCQINFVNIEDKHLQVNVVRWKAPLSMKLLEPPLGVGNHHWALGTTIERWLLEPPLSVGDC